MNLAEKAKKHHALMENTKSIYTDGTVLESTVYLEDAFDNKKQSNRTFNNDIVIADLDSITAAYHYEMSGRVALLNFASFTHPGGAFLFGSRAQEEAICHESNLFEILNDDKFSLFYRINQKDLGNHLYYNRGIYSPGVILTRDNDEHFTDVITVAAPNAMKAYDGTDDFDARNLVILKSRIDFILKIAEANHVDTLILGAFGCGVFGQSPYDVATCFKDLLPHYNFKKVVFAIPDFNDGNLEAFKEVFTEENK